MANYDEEHDNSEAAYQREHPGHISNSDFFGMALVSIVICVLLGLLGWGLQYFG